MTKKYTVDLPSTSSGALTEQDDTRRYLRGFIAAMIMLSKEDPGYGLVPGLKAFAEKHIDLFTDEEESMREVILKAIGNDEALHALATGDDLVDGDDWPCDYVIQKAEAK